MDLSAVSAGESFVARVPASPVSARAALGATPWLQAVGAATLDRLAEQAMLHRMPAGSILFHQSETPSFALFLMSGNVELLGISGTNEALIETVHPIDLLLPAAVLNRQPYLARARVVSEAYLVLIHADAFRTAVATDHALCLAVLACQAAQFRRQVKLVKNLNLRSAEQRVGCYLRKLLGTTPPGTSVRLVEEKRKIAWQLGMTRETFSRTLALLGRHGLRVNGDTIELADAAAFQARFPLDPLIDGPEPIQPFAPRHE